MGKSGFEGEWPRCGLNARCNGRMWSAQGKLKVRLATIRCDWPGFTLIGWVSKASKNRAKLAKDAKKKA